MSFLYKIFFRTNIWITSCFSLFHRSPTNTKLNSNRGNKIMLTTFLKEGVISDLPFRSPQKNEDVDINNNDEFKTLQADLILANTRTYHSSTFDKIKIKEIIYSKSNLIVARGQLYTNTDKNGSSVCVKFRKPYVVHEKEADHYLMISDKFPSLFPKMHFTFSIRGEWGGMVMSLMDCSVSSIFFPANKKEMDFAEETVKLFNNERPKEWIPTDTKIQVYVTGASLESALLAACIELLRHLHKNGWIHGDSHLGNFVLDRKNWRVYAIDVERTFQSEDLVQQFMDIQEVFGHASSLLINEFSWDMQEIMGVACKLHPRLSNKNIRDGLDCFNMLPVCSCFTEETQEGRLEGCMACKSPFNRQSAELFQDEWMTQIRHMFFLSIHQIVKHIQSCKHTSKRQCNLVVRGLKQCFSELQRRGFVTLCEYDENCIINWDKWVRKLLFEDTLCQDETQRREVKDLAHALHIIGRKNVARLLLEHAHFTLYHPPISNL